MSTTTAIETFISDVKQILTEEPADRPSEAGLEHIRLRMETLVRNRELAAEWANSTGRLWEDESGLLLLSGRFGPETMTPIHTHGSWGVIGIYQGRDRYQIWRRLDPGDGAGKAKIELSEERVLEPGDVVILPPPPQDIHAQQGMDGDAVYELILFGADTMVLPRLYFDPEHDTAESIAPGQPGSHLRMPHL